MKRLPLLLAGMVLSASLGCAPAPTVDPESGAGGSVALAASDAVVAETRLGPITAADLDRFLLDRGPASGAEAPALDVEHLAGIARRLAIHRLLLAEAELVGADLEPQFRAVERRIRRTVLSDDYLAVLPPAEPVTRDEVQALYEERRDAYQREEKRQVRHIYKRTSDEVSREQAVAELQDLRARLLDGENFERLAQEHSDSDTRHSGGLIGVFGRGEFTKDFDSTVFALEERVPSEPVTTRDGAHIFLVEDIVEERDFGLEEMLPSLYQELREKRLVERQLAAAQALPQPEPLFVPGPGEIGQVLRLGDPSTVVLRVGDFALTLGEFQEALVTQRRQQGATVTPDLPLKLLEDISSREIIYQYLVDQGLGLLPIERLQQERDRELADFVARRKMMQWIERKPELLKSYYDNNRMRFTSKPRVHLRMLSVPQGEDGPAQMAALEAATGALDAGSTTLEALAESFGGGVQDLGFVTAGEVQAKAPRALRFVFLLEAGKHTPPYAARGGDVRIFQVVERLDPEQRALALVRDEVVEDYLTNNASGVFDQLADEMLEAAKFRVDEERLQALSRRSNG